MTIATNPLAIIAGMIITGLAMLTIIARPKKLGSIPIVITLAVYIVCILAIFISVPVDAREYNAEQITPLNRATYFAFAIWGLIVVMVAAAIMNRVILAIICLVLLAAVSQCVKADRLHLGGWSAHTSNYSTHHVRYNETHYMLGYERNNYMAAVFKNSYNDWAIMAGRMFIPFDKNNIQFTANLGGNYGYRECYGDGISHEITAYAPNGEWLTRKQVRADKQFCLHLIPGLRWTKHKWQPHLQAMPGAAVITINYDW